MKNKEKYSLEARIGNFINISKIFVFTLLVAAVTLLTFERSEKCVQAYLEECCGSNFVGTSELPSIQLNVEEGKESEDQRDNGKSRFLIIVCAVGTVSAVVAMAFVAVIIVLRIKRKIKKNINQEDAVSNNFLSEKAGDSNLNGRRKMDKREIAGLETDTVKKQKVDTDVLPTMMLWQITIRLINIQNRQEIYEKSIDSTEDFARIYIGRGEHKQVDIKIQDKDRKSVV